MSFGLAPSKTTVYCSNLPFNLTNNDLHTIFEKYGKVVKVTVMKDKETRQSKGVVFALFLDQKGAHTAVNALHNKELFGRTLKCSVAKDNGRTPEFIRRKTYPDKSRCYECGEFGHLSYQCPNNAFGERELPEKKPEKKPKKRRRSQQPKQGKTPRLVDEEDQEDFDGDEDLSLGDAIRESWEHEQQVGQKAKNKESKTSERKALKQGYFSDEDASD